MKTIKKTRKTARERRIEILKDALLQIKRKLYTVTQGTYVELPDLLDDLRWDINYENAKDVSAQKCLLTSKEPCQVCAKGAIFLSLVRKENKVKLSEVTDDGIRELKSNRVFGEANLNRMEAAFEQWYYRYNGTDSYSGYYDTQYNTKDEAIYKFVNKYPDKEERLIAILKNAIKNDGIFKP